MSLEQAQDFLTVQNAPKPQYEGKGGAVSETPPSGVSIKTGGEAAPAAPRTMSLEQAQSLVSKEIGGEPSVNIGGQAFIGAAHAAKPAIEFAGGLIAHGTSLLNKLGLVNERTAEAAAQVRNNLDQGWQDFVSKSEKYYGVKEEDFPVTAGAADVAGQVLLYSVTSPAFAAETAFGRALLGKYGTSIVGRLVGAATQGAVIEGFKSRGEDADEVGTDAFLGALGSLGGQGVGEAIGAGASKIINASTIARVGRWVKGASEAWNKENTSIAKSFEVRARVFGDNRKLYFDDAEAKMRSDGILPSPRLMQNLPANASASTRRAVQKYLDYKKDTEFYTSDIFKSAVNKGVGGAETGGSTMSWKQFNDSIIKRAMGDDKVISEKILKMFSPREREMIKTGMLYQALERATVKGTTKYNPTKLKEVLDTAGIRMWFNGPKEAKLLKGFENIVGESKDIVGHHPYLVAHGMTALAGGAFGYEEGGWRGAVGGAAIGGFFSYIVLIRALSGMMHSQTGRNLIAAAADAKPGSRASRTIFERITRAAGAEMTTQ